MSFIQCGSAVHFYEFRPAASLEAALLEDRSAEARASSPGALSTLVFVNGLGTTHRIWDDMVATLPRRWSLLRYDARGHGLTEVGECPYTVAALSSDLSMLLDRLGLRSVAVCGLSVGGLVAQALAASEPERVRAAILCATALRIGSPELWQGRASQVRAGGLASISASSMLRWFGDPYREQHPEIVAGHRTMLERTSVVGYLATTEALSAADLSSRAPSIAAPTLVVSGELDVSTPPALGQALAASIPGAQFRLLEGAGHLLCVERHEALAGLVTRFLGDIGFG